MYKDHPYRMERIKLFVLIILCLQNTIFTLLRRYSQGVLKEEYSSYEVLLLGEIIKIAFSAYMISSSLERNQSLSNRLTYLTRTCLKMAVLALIYGAMNILSFIALQNIGAGTFTIFAQCKILTTAGFSALMLNRSYSWAQWRALLQLMVGVLLFSISLFDSNDDDDNQTSFPNDDNQTSFSHNSWGSAFLGTFAVLMEVTLSGFASIYFEKVIKQDVEQLNIWERNFQLGLGSVPIYMLFILNAGGGKAGYFGDWSFTAFLLSILGAAGGLLVALSIKYGDAILKTLATTGAIVLSSVLDFVLLSGPLTFIMILGGVNVVLAICNYTFDTTPKFEVPSEKTKLDNLEKVESSSSGLAV